MKIKLVLFNEIKYCNKFHGFLSRDNLIPQQNYLKKVWEWAILLQIYGGGGGGSNNKKNTSRSLSYTLFWAQIHKRMGEHWSYPPSLEPKDAIYERPHTMLHNKTSIFSIFSQFQVLSMLYGKAYSKIL